MTPTTADKVKEIIRSYLEFYTERGSMTTVKEWLESKEGSRLVGELVEGDATEITTQLLYADGWVRKTGDPVFPIEKKIGNQNPLNASEDTNIELVIHGMYNNEQFAIQFPDGGLLNFNPRSMEDLKAFERMVSFYDAPF